MVAEGWHRSDCRRPRALAQDASAPTPRNGSLDDARPEMPKAPTYVSSHRHRYALAASDKTNANVPATSR